ncbi:heparinase II/III family protein [Paenibacillus sp. J2TS4]|uniref:FIMAH domain-containing protein n=1 Tax=Paenibacillus sp. J2TS4 TaxID=2807194 RepID=UPI001AFEBAC7|nr:heparinase II/III family protein [Paenibacillus sp. J2TS4]GIP32497.1 hypothetical protein J2TS4_17070 [Paenibacillus sp. J2TS4]
MGSYAYKRLSAKLSVILTFLLVVSMLPVSFAASFLSKAQAAEQPMESTYRFIDAYSGNANIRVLGDINEKPITRKVDLYGTSIAADAVGQSRSFELDVPKTGYYLVNFQGYIYKAAGIGDLFIDDERIGQYDFYDPGSMFGPSVPLKTVYLTEGTHTLTFTVTGRNEHADKGSNYSLYPYQFTLIEQQGLPALHLEASTDKEVLLSNETTSVLAAVYKSDGTPVHQVNLSYSSDDSQIASVDESGLITGLAEGSTYIRVQAEADGLAADQAIRIQVMNAKLESVVLELDGAPLPLMGTRQLRVSGKLSSGADANLSGAVIQFQSDDPETVSVDDTGQVTGLKLGTANIHAQVTLASITQSAELPIEVTNSHLQSVQLSLDDGAPVESQYVKASVEGLLDNGEEADLSHAEIEFTSSDGQVLQKKTDNGFFKAVGAGTAVITVNVTFAGITQSDQVTVEVGELMSSKIRSTFYTEEKVANARTNVEQYDWAKSYRTGAVTAAAKYVDAGWDFLWDAVPPQTLPRSYAVNQPLGSPVSGKEIDKWGNYPYKADPFNEPWKLIDPSAVDENGNNYRYPTNDFKSYYESGLDEQGIFRRELADPRFLVNELYPEKGETWGVDDGYGWIDDNGNYYTFISYYTHWHLWYGNGVVVDALKSLRDAYIFSGDKQYAQAGIVLLDRIADVYPSLDLRVFDRSIYWHSDGGRAGGKAVGSIWETGLVKEFVKAYDAFFPAMEDPEVMAEVLVFLQQKGEQYRLSFKDSAAGIHKNIEDGILKEVYPNIQNANIFGNNGFHQSALALAAVVYDTLPETKEWLDFNFQSGGLLSNPYRVTGGNILAGLVNTVDRDGHGNEGSPGYNRLWISSYLEVANILEGYDKYPEADLYQNVKFRKMFSAMYPLTMLERYTPSIGDTAAAGNPVHVLDLAQMIRAYEVYRDPIYAQLAYFLNNYRASGIHSDVFTENPEQIGQDLEAIIEEYGPLDLGSTNLSGFGFAGLRDGIKTAPQYGESLFFMDMDVTESSTGYKIFDSNSTVQLEATEPGHSITFAFPVETAGEFEVLLRPWRAPTYARYNVYIDDQFVKEVDFFGSSKELELLATMTLEAGEHQISFRYSGITDGASNYKMGVTELRLQDPQDDTLPEPIDTQRGMWMYYGISSGHGHRDTLNLGIHAFGLDLLPDLGYPKFADSVDMHRAQWMNNTISHNTVVVNKRKMNTQVVSLPKHADLNGGRVQLIDVEAPKVYPQASQYRRTSAMIKVDEENSYIVDFFKVQGGNDHHFSFHSMEGPVTTEGLELVPQVDANGQYVGTYAGADVPLGQRVDDVEGAGYMGSGFHWLKDVDRAQNPQQPFSIDWNVKDTWNIYGGGAGADTDVHLRLTMMTSLDEAALANGLPPDNKPGNPKEIRYFIGHRTGADLDSLFTSVIEPYKGSRFVQAIEKAVVRQGENEADENTVQAVKVTLDNGRTDYIIYSLNSELEYVVDGKFRFQGFFGIYSEVDGEQEYGYVHDGAAITPLDSEAEPGQARLTGTVTDFTRDLSVSNELVVTMDLSGKQPEDLIGQWLFAENDQIRNAAYQVRGIEALGENQYSIQLGDITLIRSFVDVNDFSKGYVYDVAPGASFVIPLTHEMVSLPAPVTLESIAWQLEEYISSGDVTKPLTNQLRNSLKQARHHWDKGHITHAVKSLGDFLKHMNNQAHQDKISEAAKNKLAADAQALIASME